MAPLELELVGLPEVPAAVEPLELEPLEVAEPVEEVVLLTGDPVSGLPVAGSEPLGAVDAVPGVDVELGVPPAGVAPDVSTGVADEVPGADEEVDAGPGVALEPGVLAGLASPLGPPEIG